MKRKYLLNMLSAVFWSVIFFGVIFAVPYPESLTQADFLQISFFIIPLALALIFTVNIFLKNLIISSSFALTIILLLFLKALDSLNIVTGLLILISLGLLVSYFKKIKRHNLTKLPKIPKLTRLRKQ